MPARRPPPRPPAARPPAPPRRRPAAATVSAWRRAPRAIIDYPPGPGFEPVACSRPARPFLEPRLLALVHKSKKAAPVDAAFPCTTVCAYLTTSSTRRFLARPSRVALLAMGMVTP